MYKPYENYFNASIGWKGMVRITWSAPARIDLSGGAADLFGLTTLSIAIDVRTRCSIGTSDHGMKVDLGEGEVDPGEETGERYRLLKTILKVHRPRRDAIVSISSDIPSSSGLGGSASFSVATIAAINSFNEKLISPYLLAEMAQRIETRDLGLMNGYQDQYCATFGGCLFMDFKGKHNYPLGQEPYAVVESIPFPYNIVVAHTGARHCSGDVNADLYKNYLCGDTSISTRINELDDLTRSLRVALIDGDYDALCTIINRNQDIIRSFDRSTIENERLIEAALSAGADAAKVTGAGCGGCIAAICESEYDASRVAEVLRRHSPYVHECAVDGGVRQDV